MTKTVALVAPSGNIKDIDELNKNIDVLKKYFNVKKYFDEAVSLNYLANTDENRAKYLEEAFLDDDVDIVLSVRGGYGALRIVDKINYGLIKNSSKIFLGSSDATILLMALSKKTNIKCYHSLMLMNGFLDNIEKNLEIIENNSFNLKLEKINPAYAKGKLWGGNLSSIVSTFSNEDLLPNEDIILFLEDLNEPMYKIDKMLFEIYRNKKLAEKIKGIIFGDFYFEKDEIYPLLKDFSKLFDVPSALSFDITHKANNVTLPYFRDVEI